MRIATWNLERAEPRDGWRLTAIRDQMAVVEADIWVLTETWTALNPGAQYRLLAASNASIDRRSADGEVWTAIWSRLPGHPVTLRAEPDRTAASMIATPSGETLLIYGTVMPWLADAKRAPVTGAEAFLASLAVQSAEWRELQSAHSQTSLVVAGDFNQDLADKHYYGSKRGRAGLIEVLAARGLRCLTRGRRDPVARQCGHASIDHICVPIAALGSVGAWPGGGPPNKRVSDHYGVWADVIMPAHGH